MSLRTLGIYLDSFNLLETLIAKRSRSNAKSQCLAWRGMMVGMMISPQLVEVVRWQHSIYVRFSLLALSSIFFLVDPFAALPTFIAVTAGADGHRRRAIAWKASLTTLVVLTACLR